MHLAPFSSVQFWTEWHSVVSDSLRPHELQHPRPPCPSPTPGVYSNSRPLSRWCHSTISSSVVPFSSCPQSLPASGSFPMSQLVAWGGESIGVSASASVLPMNAQDWSHLGWTDWISLQSKGLSRVFSSTTVQKHQFFGAQLSSQSNSHIHTWPLEKPYPWPDGPLLAIMSLLFDMLSRLVIIFLPWSKRASFNFMAAGTICSDFGAQQNTHLGLSWWLSGKKLACQCRRQKCGFNPWVRKISWRRSRQPTPVFLPGKSHGQKEIRGLKSMGSQKSQTWLSN